AQPCQWIGILNACFPRRPPVAHTRIKRREDTPPMRQGAPCHTATSNQVLRSTQGQLEAHARVIFELVSKMSE
ncbi:MAG: hypothetical protein O7G88_19735, partial [bacterium]|nr:hypothetical protein [bacterium]